MKEIPDIAEISRRLKQIDNDDFDRLYPIICENVYEKIFLNSPCLKGETLFEVNTTGVSSQVFRRIEIELSDTFIKNGYMVQKLEISTFFSCVNVIYKIKIPSPPKFRSRCWCC